MKTSFLLATLISTACFISTALSQERTDGAVADDPLRWLEEIEGPAAVAWVRAENEKTLGVLQSDPRYRHFYEQALSFLKDRMADIPLEGRGLEHFWQDENQVRGVWRRTTRESDRNQVAKWEAILDVDALAIAENRNWVFRGASCLPPEERLCLISLSDGGKDAVSIREFDRSAKAFVANGFYLPEGKQDVSWVDRDTLLVAWGWGEGTLTQAGYPFVVKELKRAQSLSKAREIFRGEPTDRETQPLVLRDSEGHLHATGAVRAISSFESEYVVFRPDGHVTLNLPKKAEIVTLACGRLLVKLDQDWTPSEDKSFTAGSVISYDLDEWKHDPLRA